MRRATMDRQAARPCGGWRAGHKSPLTDRRLKGRAVRRSRHVSDPQPGARGCRLEATHSVPPEIRTCDRRPGKLNAVLQTVPTVRITPSVAARNGAQRKLGRSPQYLDDRLRRTAILRRSPPPRHHRQRHAHRIITTDDDGASVATTAGSRQKRQNRKSLPRRGAKVNCRC
jgi:hypothetical protein